MTISDPRASFFPKRKVRVLLSDWKPKMNSEGEKRIRMDLQIPLIDDNREGVLPAWVYNELLSMEREDSVATESKLSTTLEGVTLEVWATNKSPERMLLLAACTMQDFMLKRITSAGQTALSLLCNTNVKRDWKLLSFCDKHEDCFVWIEFTPTEPQLPALPVDNGQMSLTESSSESTEAEEREARIVEKSLANVTDFFTAPPADDMPNQTEDRAIAIAAVDSITNSITSNEVAKQEAATPIDSGKKPRRPRGFAGPTNGSVN